MEGQNDNNTSNTSFRDQYTGLLTSARNMIDQTRSRVMESTVVDQLRGAGDWFHRNTFGRYRKSVESRRELEETRTRMAYLEKELDETRSRLSAIISSRIRDNNPNIVNLGDPFRPNKLGEMSSELYDNEWTDAFEELVRKGYAETESIRIFLDIIMTTYQLCKKSTEDDWAIEKDRISDDAESARTLREGQKAKAVMAMEIHQSKIAHFLTAGCRDDKLRPLLSDPGPVRVYVDACVKLCLLMVLHDPPLVWKCPQWSSDIFPAQTRYADVNDEEGLPEQKNDNVATSMQWEETSDYVGESKTVQFYTSLFKAYTAAGDYIEYIVWPAMLLHENGPILRRGVAQGFQKKASSETTCVNVPTVLE